MVLFMWVHILFSIAIRVDPLSKIHSLIVHYQVREYISNANLKAAIHTTQPGTPVPQVF